MKIYAQSQGFLIMIGNDIGEIRVRGLRECACAGVRSRGNCYDVICFTAAKVALADMV
jgi:hypothetical protein